MGPRREGPHQDIRQASREKLRTLALSVQATGMWRPVSASWAPGSCLAPAGPLKQATSLGTGERCGPRLPKPLSEHVVRGSS